MALVVSGIIAGGVILNPIVLGTMISGAGVKLRISKGIKVEMCKFVYRIYDKFLTDLRSLLRGE